MFPRIIVWLIITCFFVTPVQAGFNTKGGGFSSGSHTSSSAGYTLYIDYADKTVLESNEDILTIPVRLTKAVGFPVTATITLKGAKSQAEDYGFGKNYVLAGAVNTAYDTSTVSRTIPAGQTETNISIGIVNNSTIDKKAITLSLSGVSGGISRKANGPTITITDAGLSGGTYINALAPGYGLTALDNTGTRDNKAYLQAMIDYIHTHGNTKGMIYFPSGTYLTSVRLPLLKPNVGITFAGPDTGEKPIIKIIGSDSMGSMSITKGLNTVIHKVGHGLTSDNDLVYFQGLTQTGWTALNWGGATDYTTTGYWIRKIDNDSFSIHKNIPGGFNYKALARLEQGNPAVIELASANSMLEDGGSVLFRDINAANWTALNGNSYQVVKLTSLRYQLVGVNATGWGDVTTTPGNYYTNFNSNSLAACTETSGLYRPNYYWGRIFEAFTFPASGAQSPVAWKNLVFDGNLPNNGPFRNYEMAQAHAIFMAGNVANVNQLAVKVEGVDFVNIGGDGISVSHDVLANIYNCTMTDVMRGGVTFTGGRSESRLKLVTTAAGTLGLPTGLDAEVDGAGYGGTYAHNIYLYDVTCRDGDIDLCMRVDGTGDSTIVADRLVSSMPPSGEIYGFSYSNLGTGTFTNSTFYTPYYYQATGGGANNISMTGTLSFTDCNFIAVNRGVDTDGFISAVPKILSVTADKLLSFTRCNFRADSGISSSVPKWGVVHHQDIAVTENRRIAFTDCVFESSLNGGYRKASGYLGFFGTFTGCTFNHDGGNSCYGLWLTGRTTANQYIDLTLNNCDFNGPFAYLKESDAAIAHIMRLKDVRMTAANNIVGSASGIAGITFMGIEGNAVLRTISAGTGVPGAAVPGFYGTGVYDRYIYGAQSYKCTKTGTVGFTTPTWSAY